MKKGKKVIAVVATLSMAMASLTACGGGNGKSEATTAPTRAVGETVKVNEGKISEGAAAMGIEVPEKVDNNADAKKIALKVWCPAEEQELMEKLCTEFDDSRPEYDIEFTYEFVSEADVKTQLSTDPSKSADVFMFPGDQMVSLVDNKLLYNISLIADEVDGLEKKYDENAYNSCVMDKNLYALPFTPNQFFLYYNTEMFTEDEVKNLDTMMAKDLGEGVKNFSTELANGWYILSYFYGAGCTLFGANGDVATECDWNGPKGLAVTNYLNNMVATGKFYNNDGENTAIAELKAGTLASLTTGSWNSNAIKEALGDKYGAAACPAFTIDGVEGNMKPFADYKAIGVNAVTVEPQAAAYLAYFLCDEYAQCCRLIARAYAPTIVSLQEAVFEDENLDPAVSAATLQNTEEHCAPRPKINQIASYWSYGENLGKMIYNQDDRVKDPTKTQSTLDKIVTGITTVLN